MQQTLAGDAEWLRVVKEYENILRSANERCSSVSMRATSRRNGIFDLRRVGCVRPYLRYASRRIHWGASVALAVP